MMPEWWGPAADSYVLGVPLTVYVLRTAARAWWLSRDR